MPGSYEGEPIEIPDGTYWVNPYTTKLKVYELVDNFPRLLLFFLVSAAPME